VDKILNIFKRKKPAPPYDVKTAPLTDDQLRAVTSVAGLPMTPQLMVGMAQSVGLQRDHNEDTVFAFSSNLGGDTKSMILGLFIVADGMGGYQHGELASSVAANAMAHYLLKKVYMPMMNLKSELPSEPLQEMMQTAVTEAQQAVIKHAPGGGTTLTSVLILGDQVTLAHVGDSRAYFIYSDGRVQPITRDHSLVRRLQELGQINEKEAAEHPQRNVLYRALGQSEPFEPDISTYPFPNAGYLLLCSDGLWGLVPESEMFSLIHSAPNLTSACQKLVDAANAAGGPDNISVILVQYPM
jgi:serine/threonine protein phosphatase PrpC